MEDLCKNYLTSIPDELKIQIFSYLSTFDIMQLCQIPALEHLSYDKNLIREICLYKEYRCGINIWNSFVLNKFRSEIITSLNINCVYWIPAHELRKCFVKLRMLESFYAVDTKLGLSYKDSVGYMSLPHLKILALTILDHDLEGHTGFPSNLVSLYLHIELIKHESITKLSYLLSKLKLLEELWAVDLSPVRVQIAPMRILFLLPSSVKKLTLAFHRVADFALINTLNFNGITSFKNFKKDMVQMCFEKFDAYVNNVYCSWDFEDANWDTLINRLKYDYPFGKKDVKRLILGKSTPENLDYEELNVVHSRDVCNSLFKTTARLLLTSTNMKLLKKLSINFCLCEQGGNEVAEKEEPLFKRARIGISNCLPNKSTLEKITESSLRIEELEIWKCTGGNLSKVTNAALSSIQNMKNLKRLTLHGIPEHIDGQFLIAVCKGCELLESLRIKASVGNNNLHNYLCMALPHATTLKDFRYEHYYIPIDKILDSFNKSTDLKLERMLLKCQSIEKFSAAPFQKYLSNNVQLRFLCIIITEIPKCVIRDISKTVNNYKSGPEKIFIVTNNETNYSGRLPIPHVHRREMLIVNTRVSAIDIFNEFAKQ